jgi:alanyl-tRNA synthetase
MRNSEIRETFFSYFDRKKHYKVFSSPLIPAKDPTIIFTNAGMNQFKDVFLGMESREYKRAVSIQKCMRVSGKHNDFDEVGKTEYHHTFFEMLGNFSFGNYFKEKAIEFAWELLTQKYRFNPDHLWVSVFREDDEAFNIWEKQIGVPLKKIIRLGEKDNFWQMGETGPCGPCSEIHFDKGEQHGPIDSLENPNRFVEIWNLVFMQYNRDREGNLNPLKSPSIDTGMGMERLTSLLQGVDSNYQTDLFKPIIEFTADMCGIHPDDKASQIDFKVIADHIRALSFLISDGVLPANDGRGYVLRRLLRRASKHGKSLGFKEPFLHRISLKVVETMKPFYPELEYNRDFISEVLLAEEERFNHTLLNGLRKFEEFLEKALAAKDRTIPGIELFKLSDTYGFPLDFAVDLATEQNVSIDLAGFQQELDSQRKKSRLDLDKKKKSGKTFEDIEKHTSVFTGYSNLTDQGTILAIYEASENPDHFQAIPRIEMSDPDTGSEEILLLCDRTPFYPESGGQVGDTGIGKNETSYIEIHDTQKLDSGAIIHFARIRKGKVNVGDRLMLSVNANQRKRTAIHHSATHLLHYALREVLGLHVKQAGSYVGPDKLRFDFTHFKSLSEEEIKKVETIVNRKIRENLPSESEEIKYEIAIERGAIALFEEKYSDLVRVISIGDTSMELCGGTHIQNTGEIGLFKITTESSISSGIRRIEAIGGENAFILVQKNSEILGNIQHHFNQSQENLFDFLVQLEKTLKEKEKQMRKREVADQENQSESIGQINTINNIKTVVEYINKFDRQQLRSLADKIKNENHGISILFSNINGKSAIIVSVFKNLTKKADARTLIKEIAVLVEGDGGGRADFAQAGGKPIKDIPQMKKVISDILKKHLS